MGPSGADDNIATKLVLQSTKDMFAADFTKLNLGFILRTSEYDVKPIDLMSTHA